MRVARTDLSGAAIPDDFEAVVRVATRQERILLQFLIAVEPTLGYQNIAPRSWEYSQQKRIALGASARSRPLRGDPRPRTSWCVRPQIKLGSRQTDDRVELPLNPYTRQHGVEPFFETGPPVSRDRN
jgi:hypothetical protein